jgi:hypothetical protein
MASKYAKLALKDMLALLKARDEQVHEQEKQIADLEARIACLEEKNEDLLDSIAAAFPKCSGKSGIPLTAPVEVSCGLAKETSMWPSPVEHATMWPSPVGHATVRPSPVEHATVWPSPVGHATVRPSPVEYDAAAEALRIGAKEDEKERVAAFEKAVQVVKETEREDAVKKHFVQVEGFLTRTYCCPPKTQDEWIDACHGLVALNVDAFEMVRPDFQNIQDLASMALNSLLMESPQGFRKNIDDLRSLLAL